MLERECDTNNKLTHAGHALNSELSMLQLQLREEQHKWSVAVRDVQSELEWTAGTFCTFLSHVSRLRVSTAVM